MKQGDGSIETKTKAPREGEAEKEDVASQLLVIDRLVTLALEDPPHGVNQLVNTVRSFFRRFHETDNEASHRVIESLVRRSLLRRLQREFEHPRLCYLPLELKALCARKVKAMWLLDQ